MRKPIAGFVVLLVMAASGLPAQESNLSGAAMSLEAARTLALVNSRNLARYNLTIQSNLLAERSQFYSELPQLGRLSINAGANLWPSDMFQWSDESYTEDYFKRSLSAGISIGSVSYTIWDGGKDAIRREINSLTTEMSRQDALSEYYSVLASVDSAYYNVLEAIAALEAAEGSLATSALSLSMAEIRYQSGMISDSTYLQALADNASRETSRNQSRRDLTVARLRLKDLLGIDELPDLEPVDFNTQEELISLLVNIDDSKFEKLFNSFWTRVQANNPTLIKSGMNSARSDLNTNLSSRDYYPTISASLGLPGLSTGYNRTNDNFELRTSGGSFSISASIPIEIWKTKNSVDRQKNSNEMTSMEYAGSVNSMSTDLYIALLDLISQAGLILSSRRALDYAQKHFDYVLELYRMSRNSPSDLSDAESLVRSNRNQLNRYQYSFLNGLSKLRSMGAFNSEDEIMAMIFSIK